MSIKGKQILDDTITQSKLDLIDPINLQDAATKNYADITKSVEYNSIVDKNISALVTAVNGDLATNQAITEQPISGSAVDVYINGIKIPVGTQITDFAYFSAGNLYKRVPGNERIGDMLYWNGDTNTYQLATNDEVDYVYLITNFNNGVNILSNGDTFTYIPNVFSNLFTFDGIAGETATIIIDGVSFIVGDVAGDFVFDIGNVNGELKTFTFTGENITIVVNASSYNIIYDGLGSQKFTILNV